MQYRKNTRKGTIRIYILAFIIKISSIQKYVYVLFAVVDLNGDIRKKNV